MTAGRTVNSSSKEWCTPEKYVNAILKMFEKISLDPCSNSNSIVPAQASYILPTDGLKESWNFPTIYVNPPYGKSGKTSIKDWLARCWDAHCQYHSEVLALVPVATNTSHWKLYVWGKASICFLADTRLKFIGGRDKGAPMACAMIYWGSNKAKFTSVFSEFGAVV